MKGKERLDKFIGLQNKSMAFEDISKEIGVAPATLKRFLNKMGYKLDEGKYVLKESQMTFDQIEKKDDKLKSTDKDNRKGKQLNNKKSESKGKVSNKKEVVSKTTSKGKFKKDRKINLTQDDLDKLCEVYDWYLEVKDYKSMQPKKPTNKKKDVILEEEQLKEMKGTSIKVEKNTWEEFERLCSNSKYSKQQIITQALKDFMKEYKHLL